MISLRTCLVLLVGFLSSQYCLATPIVDPLNSPSWQSMHSAILNSDPVIFDDRVVVTMPDFAEDAMNVPVTVDVSELDDIREIIVFADLNPIQKVLRFEPLHLKPSMSFRLKVEQATPVRAAVRTGDGYWHIGGRWLEAAGGGCTAPSHARESEDWYQTLMEVSSQSWVKHDKRRVRFRVMHPMDTGLADGIPEFYIEQFKVLDGNGGILATMETYQPISENPVFTFDFQSGVARPIKLIGADNNGNRLEAVIH